MTAQSGDPLVVLVDALLPPAQAERVRQLSPRITLIQGLAPSALRQAHVIYTTNADFDPANAPHLRWVQLDVVAANHLLRKPIATSGIPVASVRGAYTVAVAEMTIALFLALTRRFPACLALQHQRRWPGNDDYPAVRGENSYGKTMGIVGYGSIGRQVARLAQAMGMTVLACKRRPDLRRDDGFRLPHTGDPDGTIPQAWFGREQVAEMLRACDVAVVTLPQTPATEGLIGKRELAALPPHSYLINVGRGPVVDEAALLAALREGRLAGAGLDVFATEPLPPDSPFWQLPNVIVIPHLASYTQEQSQRAAEVLITNLERDLRGQALLNLVDMQAGY